MSRPATTASPALLCSPSRALWAFLRGKWRRWRTTMDWVPFDGDVPDEGM